jgi:hypothetical protein
MFTNVKNQKPPPKFRKMILMIFICFVSLFVTITIVGSLVYRDTQRISKKLGFGIRVPICYLEKCGAPIVALEDHDECLYFLVDTGCNISLLLKNAAGDVTLEESPNHICGVSGTQEILGVCEKTLTSKSGLQLSIKFSVVESIQALEETAKNLGIPIAGILGTDILTHNFIIDFKDNVVCA